MRDPLGHFTCADPRCVSQFRDEPGQHVRCHKCGYVYVDWTDWKRFVTAAEESRRKLKSKLQLGR